MKEKRPPFPGGRCRARKRSGSRRKSEAKARSGSTARSERRDFSSQTSIAPSSAWATLSLYARQSRPAVPPARDRFGEVAEVGEQAAAVLGGDRLGVELDAPLGAGAVGERHRDAVVGPGDLLQLVGQRPGQAERVVAGRLEAGRDAGEERRAGVLDRADPAVQRLRRRHHPAAVGPAEALVAEADAQQRRLAAADRLGADAEVALALGPARPRREDDVVELQPRQLVPARLVVADDDRLPAVHLRQQLEEVVGEGVVVVDQQCQHVAGIRESPTAKYPRDDDPPHPRPGPRPVRDPAGPRRGAGRARRPPRPARRQPGDRSPAPRCRPASPPTWPRDAGGIELGRLRIVVDPAGDRARR